MTRKQRYLWLGILVLTVIVIGAAAVWLPWNRDPIRYANFDKIEKGMTKAAVEALLGCRHGDHSTGTVHVKGPLGDGSLAYKRVTYSALEEDVQHVPVDCEVWHGDSGFIIVAFDMESKVIGKELAQGRRLPPVLWHWLEWRFGFDDCKHRLQ